MRVVLHKRLDEFALLHADQVFDDVQESWPPDIFDLFINIFALRFEAEDGA